MSSSKITEKEEEDVEQLRMAALKTMSRFKDNGSATESTGRSQQNMRTNTALKNNNKLYYNNSHRNGSKRPNLIILTDTQLSNSQTNSQSNHFTKIMDKTSEVSEKRKRVLPGRFSRLERDDEDSDEDTDEFSDDYSDNQLTTNSAFDQTSDEKTVVFSLTNEDSISDKIDLSEPNNDSIDRKDSQITEIKDSTNGSIKEKVKSLATNWTTDPINTCNNSSDLERKETIKLNSNNISRSEAIERRKQKFGQTSSEERVNSSVEPLNPRDSRDQRSQTNVKNRLSLKSSHKQKNSNKSNERNYKKSVSDKEIVASHRYRPNSRTDTMDSIGESDDCQHSKKRLRSLVVMK